MDDLYTIEDTRGQDQGRITITHRQHSVPVESYFTRSLLEARSVSYEGGLALSRVRDSRGRARCRSMARAARRSSGDMFLEVRRLFCRPAFLPFNGSVSVVAFSWLTLLTRATRRLSLAQTDQPCVQQRSGMGIHGI